MSNIHGIMTMSLPGAHTLSGAVIEPRALDELLPEWKGMEGHPLTQPATSSRMRFFTKNSSIPMPHPPQMSNKGNYILSLSQFTAWLGSVAEELGVEIYPGFGGAGLVYDGENQKAVKAVFTNAVGIDKERKVKESFDPGMQFNAKVTLLAEGAHGSLTKQAVKHFGLRKEIGADEQTYGMGVKEVWRVAPEKYRAGEVVHTMGWPLDWKTYGGGWVYHMADGMVSLGLVIGLDYANPYISPYRELQRMKHHPYFQDLLEGGERLAYGGRVINEGGIQSLPKLYFPGGALIGCSAGLVNVPKIKGTHNAMKSGMLAAETAFEQLGVTGDWNDSGDLEKVADMSSYESALKDSWIWKELNEVRNIRPSFNTRLGIWGGIAYSGIDSLFLKGRIPWTFRNKGSDAGHTAKARYARAVSPSFPPNN
jgi:electron-transferring-flavoprotein dehydrogenase